MRHLKLPAALLLLLLFFAATGYAKVYIDIDSPSFQKFPLAIAEFQELKPFPGNEKLAPLFAEKLTSDLTLTGYFQLLDKKAFLQDPKQMGITAEGIRFGDWTVIGAEYLVTGGFQTDGRELIAEFRLFDVVRGELVVGKRYAGTAGDHPRMATQFAGEILLALTGEAGLFDTRIAFVRKSGGIAEVHTIQYDGTDLRRITDFKTLSLSPRWSPDGRFLAFTCYKEGNPDIYLRNLSSGETRMIGHYPGLNLPGSWSRDSKRLLVTLSRDGNQEIYDMNVENGLLQRLTRDFAIDVSPSRSPDERRVAFVSNRGGSPQIYVMDNDGANVRRLTYSGNYNTSPTWSPKGKLIAYEGRVNGRFQVFVIDAEGGDPRQVTGGDGDHESPSWSPDGRYLAYSVRANGGRSRIEIMNAGGQHLRVLYEDQGGSQSPFWSPRLR